MIDKKKRRSQPRIRGVVRDYGFSAMHPYIREGLENIADHEGKSVSWIIAEIVGDYLGVDAATGKVRSITRYTRSLLDKKGRKNVLAMPPQGTNKKVQAR